MENAHLTFMSSLEFPSVIGPLLFLLYVNSVTNVALSPGSTITLYADDSLLSKPFDDAEDLVLLQEDINSLSQWSNLQKPKHLKTVKVFVG